MRVHHITNNYSMFMGGAERVVRALHAGLQQRGVESHILGLMAQRDVDVGNSQALGFKTPYDMRTLPAIHAYLRQNIRVGDIVHVHLFPSILYLSLFNKFTRLRCHLVCTEHSTSNRRRGKWFGRLLDDLTYSGYERVVAISAGVERELVQWRPNLKAKTRVIFNGTDLHYPTALYRKSKKRLIVLSVGNLRPAKNYDNALRAIALLQDLDFEYQIAGVGECQADLAQLCRELDIESKVRFLGYVEALHTLHESADIFLMPSRWEGFGLAAVEAMNASLPLVVSDVPGLREIVGGGDCAALVDPTTPESIAAGLRRLLVSHDARLQLGENAFRQSQQFGSDQMVERYLDFYSSLLL